MAHSGDLHACIHSAVERLLPPGEDTAATRDHHPSRMEKATCCSIRTLNAVHPNDGRGDTVGTMVSRGTMANNKQLTALFRAIAAENLGGATEIAAQICQQEEEKGHHTAARMLRARFTRRGTAARLIKDVTIRRTGAGSSHQR